MPNGQSRVLPRTSADLTWWDYYALHKPNAGVAGGSSRTFARPIPLTVGNSSDVTIKDISIINSPFWSKLASHPSAIGALTDGTALCISRRESPTMEIRSTPCRAMLGPGG